MTYISSDPSIVSVSSSGVATAHTAVASSVRIIIFCVLNIALMTIMNRDFNIQNQIKRKEIGMENKKRFLVF